MAAVRQTYKNHVRVDRAYMALMLLNVTDLIAAIWWTARRFDAHHLVVVGLAVAVLSASFALRHYALVNQNRIIRLEENVRLHWMGADGAGLTLQQMVALRFASDGEVVALARRAAAEGLLPKQIKEAIVSWRADLERV